MIQILLPELAPGTVLRFPCSYAEYERMAGQRGDRSIPRIKYRHGEVSIMVPLPEHGKNGDVVASVARTLLDHQAQAYDAFTPVTIALPQVGGIEPDYCFYITNWKAVQGKKRIDWQIDPPPDLVIEIDVSSFTAIEDYAPYQVPEVWLLKEQLHIYQLVEGRYVETTQSRYFPGYDLQTLVAEALQTAYEQNTSVALRRLRRSL
ncbi:MAG: Uma2 family endonuclease [Microcoleus sp. SIO2G3]|nr:Uma2 family endonuclease [Microcoleus sp. SIO2G3]